MPPAGRTRRAALWATLLIVVAVGAYAAVTTIRMVSTYGELVEARGLMLSAEATLQEAGLDASPATLTEVELQAISARSKFRSAHDFLSGEPLLRVAGWVPWMGSQVSAARALAGIGYEGSEIGLAGVAALQAFNEIKADNRGALGENVMAYLEVTEPMMTEVEERLAAIREKRDGIDTRWILPPLSNFVRQLDAPLVRAEESVEKYRHGRAVADHVLGFDEATSYLVLGLDNTELLPGGGLIGVYGVISFEKGRVVERSFSEVTDLIERWQVRSGGEHIEPPGPLKRYLLRDWTWNFGVANWSPDFPISARQALFFYDRAGSDPVDGVIAVDFIGLEGLLAVLGPREVEGYGVTVGSNNVTEEILARLGKPLRPEDGDHAFAGAVATEVVDGALAADQEKWVPLLETLARLAEEKHIFLYVDDRPAQHSVRELGWAGQVRDGPGDFLMVVNASVHSTKLNLVLEERMEVSVHLNGDGSAQNTVTLYYENQLGEWARGRDPQLVSDLMLSGFYGGYLRLLAPPQARLQDVRLNGETASVEEETREAGKASFGRYLPLPKDTRAVLDFVYQVSGVVDVSGGSHTYRLLIQKQPGIRATPLRIAVSLPPDARLESLALDDQELTDNPLVLETDLSVDRELVVVYEL